jgi:hypothetical protein
VHAYGDYAAMAALPISASLGYFYPSLGDKINLVMFIYSGLLFLECHLANVILPNCCFLYLVAGAKIRREEKKERKKERRLLVFF